MTHTLFTIRPLSWPLLMRSFSVIDPGAALASTPGQAVTEAAACRAAGVRRLLGVWQPGGGW